LLTADAALIAYLFYAGRAPAWVTGKPLNWFAELALLLGVFGAPPLIVGAVHAVCDRLGNRWPPPLPDWELSAAAALVFFTVYLIAIRPSPVLRVNGKPGEWLYDSWLGVRVPHGFTGHLISEEPYNLELELENRTSEPLYVSQITAKSLS
jgi:hypothetical protein